MHYLCKVVLEIKDYSTGNPIADTIVKVQSLYVNGDQSDSDTDYLNFKDQYFCIAVFYSDRIPMNITASKSGYLSTSDPNKLFKRLFNCGR